MHSITRSFFQGFFFCLGKKNDWQPLNSLRDFFIVLGIALTTGVVSRIFSFRYDIEGNIVNTGTEYSFLLLSTLTLLTLTRQRDKFIDTAIAFMIVSSIGDVMFLLTYLVLPLSASSIAAIFIIAFQIAGIYRITYRVLALSRALAISYSLLYFIGVLGFFSIIEDIKIAMLQNSGFM
jgi:hypothetical protein